MVLSAPDDRPKNSRSQGSGQGQSSQPQVFSLKELRSALKTTAANDVGSSGDDREVYPPAADSASYDRNFITAVRAMGDFCLKSDDLKDLRMTTRRSPNEVDPPIKVYWRRDVEAKAVQVWGSHEELQKERELRESQEEAKEQFQSLVKRILASRSGRKKDGKKALSSLSREKWPVRQLRMEPKDRDALRSQSGQVVMWAVGINLGNFVAKVAAWLATGSHAMFSEAVHSAADTVNQLILAYGIRTSVRGPNQAHPYGYSNMQYVSSLISGVGIFCMGAGLSIYHGVTGLVHPSEIESLYLVRHIYTTFHLPT